jgi:hypothetical protein
MDLEYEIEFPPGYFGPWKEGEPMTLEMETPARGYLDIVVVLRGERHPLSFFDPVRLRQEVEDDIKRGKASFAGLVVVQQVTTENVRRAVDELVREGFFHSLRPISKG